MRAKSRQSQVAHLIELIADIMLPIVYRGEDRRFYEFILEKRGRLIEQERWNKVSGRYRNTEILNIDYELLFESIEEYTKKKDPEVLFCMDEFWAHGMSTDIARIMSTTRQNIDRYISLGRIKEIRTRDKAIFELLGGGYMARYLILIILHLLGDFYLQTTKVAQCKNARKGSECEVCKKCKDDSWINWKYLLVHSLLYIVPFLVLYIIMGGIYVTVVIGVLLVTHILIDAISCYFNKKNKQTVVFIIDQALVANALFNNNQ